MGFMDTLAEENGGNGLSLDVHRLDEDAKQTILLELDKILNSHPFRNSNRSKQFLSYVVRNSLDGHLENLKERTIGIEVFQREPDYATAENPVVRINAGEVRRRLEQYYYAVTGNPRVRIEIPRGSYIPEFHWSAPAASGENPPELLGDTSAAALAPSLIAEVVAPKRKRRLLIWLSASCLGLILAIGFVALDVRHQKLQQSATDLFWSPLVDSSRPVLICIPQAVVYRPSIHLYGDYSQAHPSAFKSELERLTSELPLDPNSNVAWKDIEVAPSFGVAVGDAYAGFAISSRLAQMGKPSQLRIGSTCSFEDLRNFSSVVIGAYDNRWTMEMASNLHFVFQWDHEVQEFPQLKENIPGGRVWAAEVGPHYSYSVDYGVVTRLMDSNTGQLLISTAGLGTAGTQSAAELISNPQYLAEALHNAPREWSKKNFQIVVRTNVTDASPGTPQVVATYFW
jgi:hypothetical protein